MTRWCFIAPPEVGPWIRLGIGLAACAGVAVAVGVPSALLANPFFVRMTPVPWWSYAAWVATSLLSGILAATYWRAPSAPGTPRRAGIVANIGSILAVGCPVCTKFVVAALGVSGALGMWASIQPVLAAVSLAVLGWALWRRLSTLRSCAVTAQAATEPVTPSGTFVGQC